MKQGASIFLIGAAVVAGIAGFALQTFRQPEASTPATAAKNPPPANISPPIPIADARVNVINPPGPTMTNVTIELTWGGTPGSAYSVFIGTNFGKWTWTARTTTNFYRITLTIPDDTDYFFAQVFDDRKSAFSEIARLPDYRPDAVVIAWAPIQPATIQTCGDLARRDWTNAFVDAVPPLTNVFRFDRNLYFRSVGVAPLVMRADPLLLWHPEKRHYGLD